MLGTSAVYGLRVVDRGVGGTASVASRGPPRRTKVPAGHGPTGTGDSSARTGAR